MHRQTYSTIYCPISDRPAHLDGLMYLTSQFYAPHLQVVEKISQLLVVVFLILNILFIEQIYLKIQGIPCVSNQQINNTKSTGIFHQYERLNLKEFLGKYVLLLGNHGVGCALVNILL